MDLLLYVHVDDDHFVIPSATSDTIQDVLLRAEAAYASLFRSKPPRTIETLQNEAGCFLPASLLVGTILQNESHVFAAMHHASPGENTAAIIDDVDLPRLFATWEQWQRFMGHTLCALAASHVGMQHESSSLVSFHPVSHVASLCCSTNDNGTLFLGLFSLPSMAVLRLALQALHDLMHLDVAATAALFTQLLSAPPILAHPNHLASVLDLIVAFGRMSPNALESLSSQQLVPRLLVLASSNPSIASTIESIVALLHDPALGQFNRPSTLPPPPLAIQELLFCMHGKHPKSQDIATRQLLQLSTSAVTWHAALQGSESSPLELSLFGELLHLAHDWPLDDAFHTMLLGRILETMTNVLAFQPHQPLVHDPHAVDVLVAIAASSSLPSSVRTAATHVLAHALSLHTHLGYTNVAGFVALLRANDDAASHAVGAAALLAALDGNAKLHPARTHDMVVAEMCAAPVLSALVDALYCPETPTRVVVLSVLTRLLAEDDARRGVVDAGCIPAFVSLLVQPDMPIDGHRHAVKALAKIALSSAARRRAVLDAIEYVIVRDAVQDTVVRFYFDLIVAGSDDGDDDGTRRPASAVSDPTRAVTSRQ
ncbi:Aste57867_23893 [Aphanomyces stellatus]|uniref:Aste57867_23893 protein n=1 Tax=Aphanomyces stellatus TaxID=120398 RepID=A0A485LNY4_9STRA|nr:hypothetical protein As57867_023820 [Aphanomyces stellatus]VFU00536.1 Aste57867_23893 [Aphanomyces stellatus]